MYFLNIITIGKAAMVLICDNLLLINLLSIAYFTMT
jgi:hypothetical protein